jgi:hypothetical protein
MWSLGASPVMMVKLSSHNLRNGLFLEADIPSGRGYAPVLG